MDRKNISSLYLSPFHPTPLPQPPHHQTRLFISNGWHFTLFCLLERMSASKERVIIQPSPLSHDRHGNKHRGTRTPSAQTQICTQSCVSIEKILNYFFIWIIFIEMQDSHIMCQNSDASCPSFHLLLVCYPVQYAAVCNREACVL